MKIKDLPEDERLRGVKVRIPHADRLQEYAGIQAGAEVYIESLWAKGVWVKKSQGDTRIYPVFVKDLQEVLEWEVVE